MPKGAIPFSYRPCLLVLCKVWMALKTGKKEVCSACHFSAGIKISWINTKTLNLKLSMAASKTTVDCASVDGAKDMQKNGCFVLAPFVQVSRFCAMKTLKSQHLRHWVYLCHEGHHRMYLGMRVAAHRQGRQTNLDHLWGDPCRGLWNFSGFLPRRPENVSRDREMFHKTPEYSMEAVKCCTETQNSPWIPSNVAQRPIMF